MSARLLLLVILFLLHVPSEAAENKKFVQSYCDHCASASNFGGQIAEDAWANMSAWQIANAPVFKVSGKDGYYAYVTLGFAEQNFEVGASVHVAIFSFDVSKAAPDFNKIAVEVRVLKDGKYVGELDTTYPVVVIEEELKEKGITPRYPTKESIGDVIRTVDAIQQKGAFGAGMEMSGSPPLQPTYSPLNGVPVENIQGSRIRGGGVRFTCTTSSGVACIQ